MLTCLLVVVVVLMHGWRLVREVLDVLPVLLQLPLSLLLALLRYNVKVR